MNPTSDKTFLPLPGGLQIQVPDSLDLITPYVLLEQGDWFEDEIKFLRKILRSGEKIIDIGANYGTYTLTMAPISGQLMANDPCGAFRINSMGVRTVTGTGKTRDECWR